jgi:hypothetical protein
MRGRCWLPGISEVHDRSQLKARSGDMPRQARLDAVGTLHHVIIRGIEKRRIVNDETDRRNFVRRLGTLAEETMTPIYAWALMTNHAHILVCSGALGLWPSLCGDFDRLCGELQPAASPTRACFSEPIQIDCMPRR